VEMMIHLIQSSPESQLANFRMSVHMTSTPVGVGRLACTPPPLWHRGHISKFCLIRFCPMTRGIYMPSFIYLSPAVSEP